MGKERGRIRGKKRLSLLNRDLTERAASLNHETFNDSVKYVSIVIARAGVTHEVLNGSWTLPWPKTQVDVTEGGVKDG